MASGKPIRADDLAGRSWLVARLSEVALPQRWRRLRPGRGLPAMAGVRRALLDIAERGFLVFIR